MRNRLYGLRRSVMIEYEYQPGMISVFSIITPSLSGFNAKL